MKKDLSETDRLKLAQATFESKIDPGVLAEARRIRLAHIDKPQKFNCLLMGMSGTGKTRSSITAIKPVHMDVFDPFGATTRDLKQYIKRGDILPEDYSYDEWKAPKTYIRWREDHLRRVKIGYFDHIGTYMLDSLTTFARFNMFKIINAHYGSKGAKNDHTPSQGDYKEQLYNILDDINMLMSLPCNVIITGHLGQSVDELTGMIETHLLLAGKQSFEVPNAFMEKWITRVFKKDEGTEKHFFQVHNDGKYQAETRIGGSLFDTLEEPDIKLLMRKAGWPTADKPNIFSDNLLTETDSVSIST